MSNDPTPLIGALLREAWQAVRARIGEELGAEGFADIRPAHLAILQHPGPDGAQPGELAARAGISKQAVTNMLRELDTAGYLRRAGGGDDGRARTVRLTPLGHELVRTIRSIVRTVEHEWAQAIGEERLEDLRTALMHLTRRSR